VAAFGSTVDVGAFTDAPMLYLIDNVGSADVLFAAFPFYGAVEWPDGEPNMPGPEKDVYFIPLGGFTSFPALTPSPAVAKDYHTLTGSITLAPNCNVIKIYTTYKTSDYKADPEGETDGKYFKIGGEFFIPGDRADVINFANACINTAGILFIPIGGYYIVVGSLGHPVYLSPAFGTGKVGEGKKGTTFTAEAWSQRMITKYEGTLPLVPTAS
jgi:hypothetical protein